MHCHAGWPPMFVPPPLFSPFFMCLISVLAALRCLLIILEKKCSEGFSLLGRGFAQVVWNDYPLLSQRNSRLSCSVHTRKNLGSTSRGIAWSFMSSLVLFSFFSISYSLTLSLHLPISYVSRYILPFVILSLYLILLSTSNDEELHYTAMFHQSP